MSDEVRCRQCQSVVTAEAGAAYEEIRYLGYNIMSIQYTQEQTEGAREGFLASCPMCASNARLRAGDSSRLRTRFVLMGGWPQLMTSRNHDSF